MKRTTSEPRTWAVELRFDAGPTFSHETQALDGHHAIRIATDFARGCGWTERVQSARATNKEAAR